MPKRVACMWVKLVGVNARHKASLARVNCVPGRHPRHVNMIWPIWSVLDLTPEGRGTTWSPKQR